MGEVSLYANRLPEVYSTSELGFRVHKVELEGFLGSKFRTIHDQDCAAKGPHQALNPAGLPRLQETATPTRNTIEP